MIETSQKPFDLRTHSGIITIRNPATGQYRTVKIACWKKVRRRVVSLLEGPNNETDYRGFGFLRANGTICLWRRNRTDFYCKLAAILERPEEYAGRLEFSFEAYCRRCNRLLTTPESVEKGIGPECEKRC